MSRALDTIVVGGSAGAFGSLKALLSALPEDLPATVFVVTHASPDAPLRLHRLLQPHSRLPLRAAEDGMAPSLGEVVFAPPDHHLLLSGDRLHLRRGPRENNFRPAIDPLFRSAAVHRGSRAAGVVLSGLLDDGAAGLAALSSVGGTCLVEAPLTADYPDMPDAALRAVPDALPLEAGAIPERLTRLAGQAVSPPIPASDEVRLELRIAALERNEVSATETLGELSALNCPDCNGVLWEVRDGRTLRYRCHTGHAYGADSLCAAQEAALERSLYDTLRAHRGRAELLRRMSADAGNEASRQRLLVRAEGYDQDAELIEDVLTRRRRTVPSEAPA